MTRRMPQAGGGSAAWRSGAEARRSDEIVRTPGWGRVGAGGCETAAEERRSSTLCVTVGHRGQPHSLHRDHAPHAARPVRIF